MLLHLQVLTGDFKPFIREFYYLFLSFRFRPTFPVEPWEGVKDATDFGRSCIQTPYLVPDKIVGSEDCLYLNIFTKSLDSKFGLILALVNGNCYQASTATQMKI